MAKIDAKSKFWNHKYIEYAVEVTLRDYEFRKEFYYAFSL